MAVENPSLRSPLARTTLIFFGIALVCTIFADIAITTVHPWREMSNLLLGLFTPDFFTIEDLGSALLYTLAFALLGVAVGNMIGFLLSLIFFSRIVRTGCAIVRAIHELFWALIFLQIFGLSPLTGILAIAIPYAGIIAKVYAEILEEADPAPLQAVPYGAGRVSVFLFVRLPDAWAHFRTYSLYRLECGLRSSAVLGFVGLPTLGYHLESAFKQGQYSQVWALLFIFYLIIASIRIWMKKPLLPIYLIGSILVLPWDIAFSTDNIWRFFGHDIIPYPLRASSGIDANNLGGNGRLAASYVVRPGNPRNNRDTAAHHDRAGCNGNANADVLPANIAPMVRPRVTHRRSRVSGCRSLHPGIHPGLCIVATVGPVHVAGARRPVAA